MPPTSPMLEPSYSYSDRNSNPPLPDNICAGGPRNTTCKNKIFPDISLPGSPGMMFDHLDYSRPLGLFYSDSTIPFYFLPDFGPIRVKLLSKADRGCIHYNAVNHSIGQHMVQHTAKVDLHGRNGRKNNGPISPGQSLPLVARNTASRGSWGLRNATDIIS